MNWSQLVNYSKSRDWWSVNTAILIIH